MGPFRGSGIYGGYGIYGSSEPDLRDYRTHPIIEQQLLNPSSQIWEPGNIFLRPHPEYLYPCLGKRIVRASDSTLDDDVRKQAAHEVESLRRSIRTYFQRTRRRPGRPSKLTPTERDRMAEEHTRLSEFIRALCAVDAEVHVPHEELNRLFQKPMFRSELFSQFPLKRPCEPPLWDQFLADTATRGVGERALRYLALRYHVSHYTIHRAIWPDRLPPEAAQDIPSSPSTP